MVIYTEEQSIIQNMLWDVHSYCNVTYDMESDGDLSPDLAHWSLKDVGKIKLKYSNSLYRRVTWSLSTKLFSCKYQKNSLMSSQHRFRQWLAAVKQQAITLTDVNPNLCHHIASLGHNESGTKSPLYCRRHFQSFPKKMYFPGGSVHKKPMCIRNVLVPNRRQASIWWIRNWYNDI